MAELAILSLAAGRSRGRAADLSVANLQGAGIRIPELAVGSSLTFTLEGTGEAGDIDNLASVAVPTDLVDSYPENNVDSDKNSLIIATTSATPSTTATATLTPPVSSRPPVSSTPSASATATAAVAATGPSSMTPTGGAKPPAMTMGGVLVVGGAVLLIVRRMKNNL